MIGNILKTILGEEKSTITKEISTEMKGSLGELRQEIRLEQLERDKYKTLNDIIITNKSGTTQIDHLVISIYGIFVIENKNYAGYIYGSERNTNWTQIIKGCKTQFHNPVRQNYGHIKSLEEIIGTKIAPHSVIVFSEKAVLSKIEIESDNIHVINESELVSFIKSYNKEIMSFDEVKTCTNKVLENMSSIRQDIDTHINNVKENLANKGKICPRCNSELVKREGKYGEFLGCSAFPKCRYIYKE